MRVRVRNITAANTTASFALRSLGGYTARFIESFSFLELHNAIPQQVPHFSYDKIVDCENREFNLLQCSSAGFATCSAAAQSVKCLGSTSLLTPAGARHINLSCDFFDGAVECDQASGAAAPDNSLCSEGEVMACNGWQCVPSAKLGDGTCDTILNCRTNGFDQRDCDDYDPFSQADEGIYCDCHGICVTTEECQSWVGGDPDYNCYHYFDFLMLNDVCDDYDISNPGLTVDCNYFEYDKGKVSRHIFWNQISTSNFNVANFSVAPCSPQCSQTLAGPNVNKLPEAYRNEVVKKYFEAVIGPFDALCPSWCPQACDCQGSCITYAELSSGLSDGICQNIPDHNVTFNCPTYTFDSWACTVDQPSDTLASCDGKTDCYGYCIRQEECDLYNVTCDELVSWLITDSYCQSIEIDGTYLNCPKHNHDSGDCNSGDNSWGRRRVSEVEVEVEER